MTPEPEKTETLEQIAKRIPKELYNIVCYSCSEAFCKHWQADASDVILSALRNERERCARVADERAAFNKRLMRTHKIGDPMADLKSTRADEAEVIAKEIREGS